MAFRRCGLVALVLAFLEYTAELLVIIEVFLLAVDVTVHDHITELAGYDSRLHAYWTDCEFGSHIFSGCNFVRNETFIVACVWLGSETHEEFCNFYCSSIRRAMKWCVAVLISYVRFRTVVKQQAKYVILGVVSSSFEEGRPLLEIKFIDICTRDDQSFADLKILLNAGECQ